MSAEWWDKADVVAAVEAAEPSGTLFEATYMGQRITISPLAAYKRRKSYLFRSACTRLILAKSEFKLGNSAKQVPGGRRRLFEIPKFEITKFEDSLDYQQRNWETPPFNTSWLALQVLLASYNELDAATNIIKDIYGNPFCQQLLVKNGLYCLEGESYNKVNWLTWKDATIVKIAKKIYETRAYEDMPILGDALAEAGCQNEKVLAHCLAGNHVRGCWLLDALLGRKNITIPR